MSDYDSPFMEFIEEFKDVDGNHVYIEKLKNLFVEGKYFYEIDFYDLYNFNLDYANKFLVNYVEEINNATFIIRQKCKMLYSSFLDHVNQIEVKIVNLIDTTPIRKLKSGKIKNLVQVKGVVVQRSKPLLKVTLLGFECMYCHNVTWVEQHGQYRQDPDVCVCGKKGWSRLYDKSEFIDYQEIYIQELMENNLYGSSLDKIKVVLLGRLIRRCEPGEQVIIVGNIEAYDDSYNSKTLELDYHLNAHSLVNITDSQLLTLTEVDENEIKGLMKQPDHLEKIIKSIAPSIYGLDYVKEALAYQQCEGQVRYFGKTRRRGQFHILLAGPPGVAKSEAGDFMVLCHSKGRKAIGKGSSGVGLTASVVKEGEQFVLKAGAMALADNGFLFIDEIEKMSITDSGAMHPCLEQQEVNIDKADISAVLKTRCSVLAACNPLGGEWNDYKTITGNLSDKGKGLPRPLLDRFALIFVIKQNKRTELEKNVVSHIFDMNVSENIVAPYSVDTLRKIFAYARGIKVSLGEEANNRLEEFYMVLYEAAKQNDSLIISRRQIQDLIRITEASARLHGRNVTSLKDAEAAVRLVAKSLEDYGIDPDTGRIDQFKAIYSESPSNASMIQQVPLIVKRLCARGLDASKTSRNEFIQYCANLWKVDPSEVGKVLDICIKSGVVYCPTPFDLSLC